jgi:hypothetical protein
MKKLSQSLPVKELKLDASMGDVIVPGWDKYKVYIKCLVMKKQKKNGIRIQCQ